MKETEPIKKAIRFLFLYQIDLDLGIGDNNTY
jgi:hypothetical protein